MSDNLYVLGIETTCDETAVAVVKGDRTIVAHRLLSQMKAHIPYGGVVPEIAARSHLDHLDGLVVQTMMDAGLGYDDLDGIAASGGPGLIGGVMVGLMTAKALALAADKPLLVINHLEAHALTARLTDDVAFPFLLLLLSGAHCQILRVSHVRDYQLLGQTIDDAVGEAFDKVARMIGLPYPGGPELEKLLPLADADAAAKIELPRPLVGRKNCDFSFAGLKTAARTWLNGRTLSQQEQADFSLAFHDTVADILLDRLQNALKAHDIADLKTLVVAGGVAANRFLCAKLQAFCTAHVLQFVAPPVALCTDNAAMVAWAGLEQLRLNMHNDMDFAARPRWPLNELQTEQQA